MVLHVLPKVQVTVHQILRLAGSHTITDATALCARCPPSPINGGSTTFVARAPEPLTKRKRFPSRTHHGARFQRACTAGKRDAVVRTGAEAEADAETVICSVPEAWASG